MTTATRTGSRRGARGRSLTGLALPGLFVCVLLAPMLLWGAPRVVVLSLDGDASGRLRDQVEEALRSDARCEVVELGEYRALAAKRRLRRGAAMTRVGVARVGSQLKLSAAVAGELTAKSFSVVIYDGRGKELWTKRLPVAKGLLSATFAKKLTRAIAAAAAQGGSVGAAADVEARGDPGESPLSDTPEDRGRSPTPSGAATASAPPPGAAEPVPSPPRPSAQPAVEGAPATAAPSSPASRRDVVARDVPVSSAGGDWRDAPPVGAGGRRVGRDDARVEEPDSPSPVRTDEEPRDSDLDTEDSDGEAKPRDVPIVAVRVLGTSTWRNQCLRPGVASCAQYEALLRKQQAPIGKVIDVNASIPYPGVALEFEVLPLAGLESPLVRGFGILGSFGFGRSLIRVVEGSTQGAGAEKTVSTTDLAWTAQAMWRLHFKMGYGEPQASGHVGIRGGLQARHYTIDTSVKTDLPSSERVAPTGFGFPMVGIDVSLPVSAYLRGELSGAYFFEPRTGAAQVADFGNPLDPTGGVQSTGFSVDVGLAGRIWGPLGWSVRGRMTRFDDRYFGQGLKWTVCNDAQCGGVGEESFLSVFAGVTFAH